MASRLLDSVLPHPPHLTIIDRNATRTRRCALCSCEKEPCLLHPWCSKKHYLLWLAEFTSSLPPNHMCMLPGCTRRVFVDDNALSSRFCGWRHVQKFVMLSAHQRAGKGQPPLVEVLPHTPPSPAALHYESEHGSLPSLNSVTCSFKQFVHFGMAPMNCRVIEDFYEKHPWEILTDEQVRWIIARPKFTMRKTRQLTTRGYRWWQRGRPVENSGYSVKYYAYTERKGKGKDPSQQHAESLYTMQEYTLEGIETHTLICLVKRKPFSKGKLGKDQPHGDPIADEVGSIACPEDTAALSPLDDDMLVDLFLKELPSPEDGARMDLLLTIDQFLERGAA